MKHEEYENPPKLSVDNFPQDWESCFTNPTLKYGPGCFSIIPCCVASRSMSWKLNHCLPLFYIACFLLIWQVTAAAFGNENIQLLFAPSSNEVGNGGGACRHHQFSVQWVPPCKLKLGRSCIHKHQRHTHCDK